MNRLTAILAVIVLTLLGSGGLSALHRATHHGSCGSACGGLLCEVDGAVDGTVVHIHHGWGHHGCVSTGCVARACASVACGPSALALVDRNASSSAHQENGPRDAPQDVPGDEPRLPLHDCGFCSLLAMPVTIAVAAAMPPSPHLVRAPAIVRPDAVIRSRHRAGPYGARAPPLA